MSPEAPVPLPHEVNIEKSSTKVETHAPEHIGSVTVERSKIDFDGLKDACTEYDLIEFTPDSHDYNDVIFYSGFSTRGGKKIKTLAALSQEANARVLTWDHLEGQKIGPLRYQHEEDIPRQQLQKIVAIDNILKHEEVALADIVAHSEGSIHAITTAYLNPSKYKNILLLNPAGLIPMNSSDLILQGIDEGIMRKKSGETNEEITGMREMLDRGRELLDHASMLIESIRGISKVSRSEIMWEMIREIRKQGITVSMVYTDNDDLFRPEEYESEAMKHSDEGLNGVFNAVYRLDGDHSSLLKPEYAKVVSSFISSNQEELEKVA